MNVVVTGGGTLAPIDDVRHIANLSSGRFSALISEACLARGANVWHVYAPGAQTPFEREARFNLASADPGAEFARLMALRATWIDARERLHLVPLHQGTVADYGANLERVLRSQPVDVVFLAMAASDFEPAPFPGKLESERDTLLIHAQRTRKVIQSVRDWAPGAYLVGFKLLSRAEESELIRQAESACLTNRADLTVANDLQTLRAGRHTIHLVRPGEAPETLPPGEDLARRLVDRVFAWADRQSRPQPGC